MKNRSFLPFIFFVIFILTTSIGCGVKGLPKEPLEEKSKNISKRR